MLHNLLTIETKVLGQLWASTIEMGVIDMAYIQKRQHSNGSITYRARLRIVGMPDKSATFSTRTQAKIWAQKMEAEIRQGRYFSKQENKERTFAELVDRYIEKELPKKPKSLAKQSAQLLCFLLLLSPVVAF